MKFSGTLIHAQFQWKNVWENFVETWVNSKISLRDWNDIQKAVVIPDKKMETMTQVFLVKACSHSQEYSITSNDDMVKFEICTLGDIIS